MSTNNIEPILDEHIGTRQMLDDAFGIADDAPSLEERTNTTVMDAFAVADSVHESFSGNDDANSEFGLGGVEVHALDEVDNDEHVEEVVFDAMVLEGVLQELFVGAKCTTLAATILVMNLNTVHGITNSFVDELLTVLHGHLLP